MRLRRLDLTRYGKFTGHGIDFGAGGGTDLHIVYGPNEAGKSTTFAAYLDLLFGIETRSRYNFLHPYGNMRIGAALEYGGAVHEFIRVKKAQNDLLDGRDRPIGQAALAGHLGGIDRESYRSMFSLDDDTLEAGGESILASQGDLGELLFSASTGLADLSRALAGLKTDADSFYRYHARGGELAELKAELNRLREQRAGIDMAASGYAQLIEARDRAATQYNEAMRLRTASRSRIDEIQRWLTALPRLDALRSTRTDLLPLAALPAAPLGWRDAVPGLQEEETKLAARADQLEHEIARRAAEIAAITIDQDALNLADRMPRLDALQVRYKAAVDIADRRVEVREAELIIAGLLARIGRAGEADPRRLLLDAATVGTLNDLIARRSGIETAIESAKAELADARRQLTEAEHKRASADAVTTPHTQPALKQLAALLAELRADDHALRRRTAQRDRATQAALLADQLAMLRPWQGTVDDLVLRAVPAAGEVQLWKTELTSAQKAHEKQQEEAERLGSEVARLRAERAALTAFAGIVSNLDATAIRSARDAAWTDHRRRLDADSADRFEAALRQDDLVVDARLLHAAEVAKLHQVNHALAVTEASEARVNSLLATKAAQLQAVEAKIAASVGAMLPAGTTLARFEAWLVQREKALEVRTRLRQAERDLKAAEADGLDVRQRLFDALQAVGDTPDFADDAAVLRERAQARLDREAEIKTLRDAHDRQQRAVTQREEKLDIVLRDDFGWGLSWREVCSGCWLGEDGSPPGLAAVREVLPAVAELGPALDAKAALLGRIDAMEQDQRLFAAEIADAAAALGMVPNSQPPLDLAQAVGQRVRDAAEALGRRAHLTRALDDARTQHIALKATNAALQVRKGEITSFFGVGSLAEAAAVLADIERKTVLAAQAEAAEREVLTTLRLPSIADAEALLDSADQAALEAEQDELRSRLRDQDQRTQELFSAHSKALDAVESVGGDDAVARIEEQRRTVHLRIEDGAMRYLRLRAGIVAAEHALRSYRQQHRSSMMAAASEAFRTITRGAYRGLSSQPNRDSETLIAVAADGATKVASDLSKGARFQLYLALRVAGYHEFARSRAPVPFIADDIMETFDDFRAEETLRLLARMSEVGQVIYLTHHQHLCAIARRVCPGVQVHELPTGAGVAAEPVS